MRLIIGLILTFGMSGCATMENGRKHFEADHNSWIGHSETELVSRFGIPNNTYESGSLKLISFTWNGGTVAMPMFGGGAVAINRSCEVIWTTQIGVIKSYTYKGNACYGEE